MPNFSLMNVFEKEKIIQQLFEKHEKLTETYQQSFTRACEDMKKAVQNINDNVEKIRDFHIHILSDLKNAQEEEVKNDKENLKNTDKNVLNNSENDIFETPERLSIEPEVENNGKHKKNLFQNYKESETPGIVECTQFVNKKNRPETSIAKILNNSRKNIITKSTDDKNSETQSQLKLNKSQNSQEKSQNTGKLSLSKTHSDIKILNGKISKQTKLVFQSVKKKQDVSTMDNQPQNKTINPNNYDDDLDVDGTFFEEKFTLEKTLGSIDTADENKRINIINESPKKNNTPNKYSLKLKNSSPRKSKNDENDIGKSMENNIDNFKRSSTQFSSPKLSKKSSIIKSNKSPPQLSSVKSPKKKQSKHSNTTPLKIFTLTNNKKLLDYDSDMSTYYSVSQENPKSIINNENKKSGCNDSDGSEDFDATYCPRAEEILKNNSTNTGKRKINDIIEIDRDTNNKKKNQVNDIDVGNGDDWNSDEWQFDKWPPQSQPASPPQKKKQLNNFDFVPEKKTKSPPYAYKGPVVRNKAERAKLNGWDCKGCEKWYAALDLSQGELQKRKNQCSRHRGKHNPRYDTPPGYWNPNFSQPLSSSEEEEDD